MDIKDRNINILLIDDEPGVVGILKSAVYSIFLSKGVEANVKATTKKEEFIASFNSSKVDMALLDIDMGPTDGIRLAEEIRKNNKDVEICFVSNCEDRVFESFSVRPFAFVRKSNFNNDFTSAAESFLRKTGGENKESYLTLKSKGESSSVMIKNIKYIESGLKHQYIYISGSKDPIEVRSTIDDFDSTLQDEGFIRVHRGFLVNINYVRIINDEYVILLDGSKVPVAKRKVGAIRKEYLEKLSKSNRVLVVE